MRRVVITGVGTVSPCGANTYLTWEAVKAGRSGIARIEAFDPTEFGSQIAGECTDFDPLDYMPKRKLREAARFIQLALGATAQAIRAAHFEPSDEQKNRVGTLIGVLQQGPAPSLSIFHSFGHLEPRSRPGLDPVRLQGTELHAHERMCLRGACDR